MRRTFSQLFTTNCFNWYLHRNFIIFSIKILVNSYITDAVNCVTYFIHLQGLGSKAIVPVWPQDHFGPTLTLSPSILRPEVRFGPRNTSALIILWPDAYFGPEILRPETTSAQCTLSETHYI